MNIRQKNSFNRQFQVLNIPRTAGNFKDFPAGVRTEDKYRRPAFKENIKSVPNVYVPPLKKFVPKRSGTQATQRLNFVAPRILPRNPTDFDEMKAINIAQFGRPVQLTDKTLTKLLRIEVPDESDINWINEKKRLVAAGQPLLLPFGRNQRTKIRTINFGEAALKNEERIAEVLAASRQNLLKSDENKLIFIQEIAKILTNPTTSVATIEKLKPTMDSIKVPGDWRKLFTHRFWSRGQIKENKGFYPALLLFSITNLLPDTSVALPFLNNLDINKPPVPLSIAELTSVFFDFPPPVEFLFDIESRTLYRTKDIINTIVSNGHDEAIVGDILFKLPDGSPNRKLLKEIQSDTPLAILKSDLMKTNPEWVMPSGFPAPPPKGEEEEEKKEAGVEAIEEIEVS